jgi:hypothetical protein
MSERQALYRGAGQAARVQAELEAAATISARPHRRHEFIRIAVRDLFDLAVAAARENSGGRR